MSPSTDRQTFRETVAQVAEKARAKLPPAINGRIESAVKLVLMHDVMPQPDGSILVASSRDPLQSYLLVGRACECQDFVHGKAPEGWCQHRIAAGIHKRVHELLPPEPAPVVPEILEPWPDNDVETGGAPAPAPPEPPAAPQPVPLPEAPASVNVRLTIAGREVQWTLRDHDEARLATRLEALLARYPLSQPAVQASSQPQLTPQQHNAAAMGKRVTDFCPVHNVPMKRHENAKGVWYSHYIDGAHCKGR